MTLLCGLIGPPPLPASPCVRDARKWRHPQCFPGGHSPGPPAGGIKWSTRIRHSSSVGGGLAGAKAAETLRTEGFTGRVWLICDERDRPYERPPLSKGFLLGKEERDSVFVHEPAWYARHDIELHLGQTVDAVDRTAKTVRFG
ncbi:3-phenylpropionate/cinnamic acid dioxygenase ferredoxin--NAD(+) reductase component [Streptomyces hirsutus]